MKKLFYVLFTFVMCLIFTSNVIAASTKVTAEEIIENFNNSDYIQFLHDVNNYNLRAELDGDKIKVINQEPGDIPYTWLTATYDGTTLYFTDDKTANYDNYESNSNSVYMMDLLILSIFDECGYRYYWYDELAVNKDTLNSLGIMIDIETVLIDNVYTSYVREYRITVNKGSIKSFLGSKGFKMPKAIIKPIPLIAKLKNNAFRINYRNYYFGATTYVLGISTDNKKWKEVGTFYYEQYDHTGLTYGKTYYYKVKACDPYGWCSAWSEVSKMKLVPNKVTLKAKTVSKKYVTLSWGKESISGYDIYMGTSKSKMKKVKTITKGSITTFKKTKLKSKKTYYFKAKAYKKVGKKKVYGSFGPVLTVKTK